MAFAHLGFKNVAIFHVMAWELVRRSCMPSFRTVIKLLKPVTGSSLSSIGFSSFSIDLSWRNFKIQEKLSKRRSVKTVFNNRHRIIDSNQLYNEVGLPGLGIAYQCLSVGNALSQT